MLIKKMILWPSIIFTIIFLIWGSLITSNEKFIAWNKINNEIDEKIFSRPKTIINTYSTLSNNKKTNTLINHNALILKNMFNYNAFNSDPNFSHRDFKAILSNTEFGIKKKNNFASTFRLLKDYKNPFNSINKDTSLKDVVIPFKTFFKHITFNDSLLIWKMSLKIFWDFMQYYLFNQKPSFVYSQLGFNYEEIKIFWFQQFKKQINIQLGNNPSLEWNFPSQDLNFEQLQNAWKEANVYFLNNF